MPPANATSHFPRLFSAVVWRDAAIAPLKELQEALREIHAQAPLHWTAPVDLHLTLRFYGNTPTAIQPQIAEGVAALAGQTAASPLEFVRYEAWPATHSRVLVARFRAGRELHGLQAALEQQAGALGFAPEARGFQPHVTLARAGSDWDGRLAQVKLAPFTLSVEWIGLWHSRVRPDPPRYAELGRYPCGPDAPQA